MDTTVIGARAVTTIIATAVCLVSLSVGSAMAANANTSQTQSVPLQGVPGKLPPATNNSVGTNLSPIKAQQRPLPSPLSWVRNDDLRCSSGNGQCVPTNAVVGGQEPARTLYVCHSMFSNGTHPGKVVDGRCDIAYGGRELQIAGFDWLVGSAYRWVPSKFGESLPPGAFIGGQEPGRNLVICRSALKLVGIAGALSNANPNLGIHPGKIVDGNCNVGYNGQELRNDVYDVLVATQ